MNESNKCEDDCEDTHKNDLVFSSVLQSKRAHLRFNTKELALISVLTSLWVASQLYLGPYISKTTGVHGVTQRVMGWFLMLTLARLTGKFGRVTAMAAIASLATRIIRMGSTYSWFVGLGYALGGLTFDLLYFFPIAKSLKGRAERMYLLGISVLSGTVALIPYLLYKFSFLGFYGFLFGILLDASNNVKSVALNVLGTLTGISILPQIEVWASKVREIPKKASRERVRETEKRS